MGKNHQIITGGKGIRDREKYDFYATPKEATELFLKHHDLGYANSFLEPACGMGHISDVLKKNFPHAEVASFDLIDRGYGIGGVDYLTKNFGRKFDVVITNPPFKHAQEFIEKGLQDSKKSVIMFAKIQFLETVKRAELFKNTHLKYVYVHSKRVSPMRGGKPLNEEGKPWSSAMCFCWFVWEHGYEGEPIIKFLI